MISVRSSCGVTATYLCGVDLPLHRSSYLVVGWSIAIGAVKARSVGLSVSLSGLGNRVGTVLHCDGISSK